MIMMMPLWPKAAQGSRNNQPPYHHPYPPPLSLRRLRCKKNPLPPPAVAPIANADVAGDEDGADAVSFGLSARVAGNRVAFEDFSSMDPVEGMHLREESSRWGYQRVHVMCPFAHSKVSGHFKCSTSRTVSHATTKNYGHLEVWGFLGAWCKHALNSDDKAAHTAFRPSTQQVRAYLESNRKLV